MPSRSIRPCLALLALAACALGFAATAGGSHDSVRHASLSATGADSEDFSWYAALSANARYAVFVSEASNLGPTVTANWNVYRRDLVTGEVVLVSRADGASGAPGNDSSGFDGAADWYLPSVSADGNRVAFQSIATNLTADTVSGSHVYVRDIAAGTTRLVSRATGAAGTPAGGDSDSPSISADGNAVAFRTGTDIAVADSNGVRDIYLRDVGAATTVLVSRESPGTGGEVGDAASGAPAISADGTHVAFSSLATNMSADDNAPADVFVRDLAAGDTELVSRAAGGPGDGGDDVSGLPAISSDGRHVAFMSAADNLSAEDDNTAEQVFRRDTAAGTTLLVSRASGATGSPALDDGTVLSGHYGPSISADGRFVAFETVADNLGGPLDTAVPNVYLRDLASFTTALVSSGGPSEPGANGASFGPSLSSDARYALFVSQGGNLPHGAGAADLGEPDVFVRDMTPPEHPVAPPLPPVTPTGPASPLPVAGSTVVVTPRGGKVLVKRRGRRQFERLREDDDIPLGSIVDVREGRVQLESADPAGRIQRAVFWDGVFKVLQERGRRPVTELRLVEKLRRCPGGGAATGSAAARKRRLWGDGQGRFRTRGRYSSATVRGTRWLVEDRCDGTLTRVARGRVDVRDFARRVTLTVKAGRRYLARPAAPRRTR